MFVRPTAYEITLNLVAVIVIAYEVWFIYFNGSV